MPDTGSTIRRTGPRSMVTSSPAMISARLRPHSFGRQVQRRFEIVARQIEKGERLSVLGFEWRPDRLGQAEADAEHEVRALFVGVGIAWKTPRVVARQNLQVLERRA